MSFRAPPLNVERPKMVKPLLKMFLQMLQDFKVCLTILGVILINGYSF